MLPLSLRSMWLIPWRGRGRVRLPRPWCLCAGGSQGQRLGPGARAVPWRLVTREGTHPNICSLVFPALLQSTLGLPSPLVSSSHDFHGEKFP